MLSEDISQKDAHILVKEMMSSIREINRRLDEIRLILQNPKCSQALMIDLDERLKKLEITKDCLIDAIYRTRGNLLSFRETESRERLGEIFKVDNLSKELSKL